MTTLAGAKRVSTSHSFIAGSFCSEGRLFENINPVDGTLISYTAEADAGMVDRAVASAREALASWRGMSVGKRAALLRRIAERIEDRFDEFLRAEVADTGKPVAQASALDIPRGAANFRSFADAICSHADLLFRTETPDGNAALNYLVRKPLGVVAVISPWNLPFLLLTWKVAPALACGNTLVVKPSEETPSSATLLASVMQEAGLPDGVFNLVHGFGPNSAGEFLAKHAGIDGITFTGESSTGSTIMQAAAVGVKPVSFELGGKNAAVVFSDADFDAAVQGVSRSAFYHAGQICLCTERVYVERPIFDAFVAALAESAEQFVPGLPEDPQTTLGPLISRSHREKVLSYYELARSEGATVVTGGGIPRFGDVRDNGFFVQPTIITGLTESARCIKEEVFGPICHVAPFDVESTAVHMANDTEYGLAASIWTSDLTRAHRVAEQMKVGTAWVNCWFLRDLRVPFGGVGLSGIGREGGASSLDFYTQPTNVCVKI